MFVVGRPPWQPEAAFFVPKLYCLAPEWFHDAVLSEDLVARLEAKIRRLPPLLILLWVIVTGFRPMMDNVDLGWHVAQGRWMVQNFAFYREDVFNYPNLHHAVIDEYPLFQIVLFLFWSLGWWGPCVLTALTYGLLALLFFRAAKLHQLRSSALYVFSVGLMFIYLQVAFPLRPHMVTYLCIAILGLFLLRHRDITDWTRFWPMALLQVAWVNCHSAFVIGPAMVALFGFEMVVRRWIAARTFPMATVKTWLIAFLLISLACLVNPYGWSRLYLPFYHDQLESIRAYVGEIQPLYGGRAAIYSGVTIVTVIVLVAGLIARRGATAYSFLLLAVVFYVQAQSVQKAWPVFGVFVPLVILGSGAFATTVIPRKIEAWLNVLGHFAVAVLAGMAIDMAVDSTWPTSVSSQWRERNRGHSELSLETVKWMKAHHAEGRIFHRCEDGGFLQMENFTQTFSDTGFGKYDEAFIHEVGLVNERPALIPRYLAAYEPDYVVCSNFCYQWPYYLKQSGWRLVFYSPNSSVWVQPGSHLDLPTVRDQEIMATFDRDLTQNGLPNDLSLLGRNIIALNSFGLQDFALAKLKGLPAEEHLKPWYWECARILSTDVPPLSPSQSMRLYAEANDLKQDRLTLEFRAYFTDKYSPSDLSKILGPVASDQLSHAANELKLKYLVLTQDGAALALARDHDRFDLRSGRRWQYVAQAEESHGSLESARVAWKKAVFYYPDDPNLLQKAAVFAADHNDAELDKAISDTRKVYGVAAP